MVDDIAQRVIALATRHDGVYLFKKWKKNELMPESSIHFDLRLDVDEAEELMDDFFKEFSVSRGSFTIATYYPELPISLNPFKKKQLLDIPDFTIGMLIESAKAGRWLYD
jgi:Protein of unknown function (DUF1493)